MKPTRAPKPAALSTCGWTARKPSSSTRSRRCPWIFSPATNGGIPIPITLLGMTIRKVTGQFYGDFLAERIFRPLGMTATRIIRERDIIPNRSSGYEWTKDGLKNQEWVSPTYNSTADGALYFNVPDLAKWDAALY